MSDCRQCADFEWCKEHEECGLFKQKPQTNADRIRAMTDEELALFIHNVEAQAAETELVSYVNEWFDWLKQEASNG